MVFEGYWNLEVVETVFDRGVFFLYLAAFFVVIETCFQEDGELVGQTEACSDAKVQACLGATVKFLVVGVDGGK